MTWAMRKAIPSFAPCQAVSFSLTLAAERLVSKAAPTPRKSVEPEKARGTEAGLDAARTPEERWSRSGGVAVGNVEVPIGLWKPA